MEQPPQRRASDDRIDSLARTTEVILQKIDDLKNHFHVMDKHYEGFSSRTEQRILTAEEEIKLHSDEIGKHGKWINNADGKIIGLGMVGTIAGGIIDHLFFRK